MYHSWGVHRIVQEPGRREVEAMGMWLEDRTLAWGVQKNCSTVIGRLSSICCLKALCGKVMSPKALLWKSSQMWPLALLRVCQKA